MTIYVFSDTNHQRRSAAVQRRPRDQGFWSSNKIMFNMKTLDLLRCLCSHLNTMIVWMYASNVDRVPWWQRLPKPIGVHFKIADTISNYYDVHVVVAAVEIAHGWCTTLLFQRGWFVWQRLSTHSNPTGNYQSDKRTGISGHERNLPLTATVFLLVTRKSAKHGRS